MRELDRRYKVMFRDPYTGAIVNREVTASELLRSPDTFPPDVVARAMAPVVLALAESMEKEREQAAQSSGMTLGQYGDERQIKSSVCGECGSYTGHRWYCTYKPSGL